MIRMVMVVVTSWTVGCGAVADTVGGDAGMVGALGRACSSDTDCGPGLVCWNQELATALGAPPWPAHGMCTAKCDGDASCEFLSRAASCVSPFAGMTSKLCLPGCDARSGIALTRLDLGADPGKCGGRIDLSCEESGDRSTCVPTCNDDAACAPAHCGANGFCTARAVGDLADIGKAPGLDARECSLRQVYAVGDAAWCTARCTLGVVPSCGWAGPSSGVPADAICMSAAAPKSGDSGFCSETCDCDSDCRGEGVRCVGLDFESSKLTKRKGFCSVFGTPVPACTP